MQRISFPALAAAFALAAPTAARQVPDQVLVVGFNSNNVLRYDGNGTFVDVFIPTVPGISTPHSIVTGPDQHLYLTSTGKDRVRRYTPDGVFTGLFVTNGSGGLDAPTHAAFGPDGNFYVSSFNTSQILRYDGTSGDFLDVFVAAGSGGLTTPEIFAFGPDGNLYVPNGEQNRVLRYNGQTGAFIDVFIAPGNGLDDPHDIAFGPSGECYVPSFDGDKVLKYDSTGAFVEELITTGLGGLDGPHGVSYQADGKLYVTSFGTNQVLRYTNEGDFDGVFIDSGNGLASPVHTSFDPEPRTTLFGPVPGTPGGTSTFTVFDGIPASAIPGNLTVFTWGTVLTNLPICPGAPWNVLDLQLFGVVAPGPDGLSSLSVPVPPGIGGVEIFFQTLEFPSCRPSQLVRFEFP